MSDLEINSVLNCTDNDVESAIRAMEALSLNIPDENNETLNNNNNRNERNGYFDNGSSSIIGTLQHHQK